jgi:hypothetical protein
MRIPPRDQEVGKALAGCVLTTWPYHRLLARGIELWLRLSRAFDVNCQIV